MKKTAASMIYFAQGHRNDVSCKLIFKPTVQIPLHLKTYYYIGIRYSACRMRVKWYLDVMADNSRGPFGTVDRQIDTIFIIKKARDLL